MKNKFGYIAFAAFVAGILVVGLVGAPTASYAAAKVTTVRNTAAVKSMAEILAAQASTKATSDALLATFTDSVAALTASPDSADALAAFTAASDALTAFSAAH